MRPLAQLQLITVETGPLSEVEQIERACAAGATWIQLRVKAKGHDVLLSLAKQARAITREAGAALIINDNLDVAQAVDADGIHVGQHDMAATEIRAVVGPSMIIGSTVNSMADARRVVKDGVADYVGLGPFKPTMTKANAAAPLTPGVIREILATLGALPAVLIGGIEAADLSALEAYGAHGVAVASGIMGQAGLEAALAAYQKELVMSDDVLKIGDRTFTSRLFTGTGKFGSGAKLAAALEASGSELVTVAFKRVEREEREDPVLDYLNKNKHYLLPNTSGVRTAKEAVFVAELGREALETNWIKLEIHPDPKYLMPDPIETLAAAEILVKKGFIVLPYVHADPVLCKRLEEVGTAAVMPLGSPIGSNQGLESRRFLEIIIDQALVPVVVDAGIGRPSQAADAMEMGADAVLVNTAIASAREPVAMAEAFKKAVECGRQACRAGLGSVSAEAEASSPGTPFLENLL